MSAPRDDDPRPDDALPDDSWPRDPQPEPYRAEGERLDDSEAVDRAFAELVANYHLTADRPDPLPPRNPPSEPQLRVRLDPWLDPGSDPRVDPSRRNHGEPPRAGRASGSASVPGSGGAPGWADDHPLFVGSSRPEPAAEPEPDERYVPEPQPSMARPGVPVLLAWLGIAYAAVVVLLAAFGLRLPPWTGWLAVGTFMIGFGVLVFHLPRSRPPGDDGAVL